MPIEQFGMVGELLVLVGVLLLGTHESATGTNTKARCPVLLYRAPETRTVAQIMSRPKKVPQDTRTLDKLLVQSVNNEQHIFNHTYTDV